MHNDVLKLAKKLNKFTYNEILAISEIEENELNMALHHLAEDGNLRQTNDGYLFLKTNIIKEEVKEIFEEKNEFDEFDLRNFPELLEKYNSLSEKLKLTVDKNLWVLKCLKALNNKKLSKSVRALLTTYPELNLSYQKIARLSLNYSRYGLEKIVNYRLPSKTKYEYDKRVMVLFKKYYLNSQKLSLKEAVNATINELGAKHPNENIFVPDQRFLLHELKKELTKEQVEKFRNLTKPPKARVKNDNGQITNEPSDMNFIKASKKYKAHISVTSNKDRMTSYNSLFKLYIKDYFENFLVGQITLHEIAKFRRELKNKSLSQSSIKAILNIVTATVRLVLPTTHRLNGRAPIKESTKCLSKDEISRILKFSKHHKKYSKIYPILFIALKTGMALGEIMSLSTENIDFKSKTIYVKTFLLNGKIFTHRHQNQRRKIFIADDVFDLLKKIKPDDGFLFLNNFEGKDKVKNFIEEYFNPLINELNLDILFSNLRDSYVKLLLEKEVPLTYIRKQLGVVTLNDLYNTYKEHIKMHKDFYDPF